MGTALLGAAGIGAVSGIFGGGNDAGDASRAAAAKAAVGAEEAGIIGSEGYLSAAEKAAQGYRDVGEETKAFLDQSGWALAGGLGAATDLETDAQREALAYLQEREALPQGLREGALTGLGGLFSPDGDMAGQQAMIDRAIASPLYRSILGGKEAGEEAILRSAGATGGLRSGDVQSNLYDYNVQLENQALLESYNQQLEGLIGLSGLPSGATDIANLMTSIGGTEAVGKRQQILGLLNATEAGRRALASGDMAAIEQILKGDIASTEALAGGKLSYSSILAEGQVAGAQAEQVASQQGIGNLMGLGQLGVAAYGAGMFSDRRLKKNIKKVGEVNGFNWYSFDWNMVANKMGLIGSCMGIMADEVFKKIPEAVTLKNSFMFVDYKEVYNA